MTSFRQQLIYIFILLSFGCSQATISREGREIPYEEAAFQDFTGIQAFATSQQDDVALKEIERFENEFPRSKYLSQVIFLKGEIYYRRGSYYSAATLFNHSARLAENSQFRSHALYNEAVSLYHVTRYQASADVLQNINRKDIPPDLERQIVVLEKKISPYVSVSTSGYHEGDRIDVSRNSVGVILPLTGEYSTFGRSALQGIQLGVTQLQQQGLIQLNLSILDDLGDPSYAQSAVNELLQKDHVIAIVGPLLGITAESAVYRAEDYGVPILPLSQKEGLTKGKTYSFSTTMTNSLQAKELASFAIEKRLIRKFAILYPNDPYGIELAKYFREEVQSRGGEITDEISYEPNKTDFRNEMKRLAKLDDFTNRIDEWNQLKAQKEGELGREVKPDEVKLPPKVDFQALFIPDYPKTLGQILPSWFAYGGGAGIVFLGANGWNSTELIRRAGKFAEGSIFVDTYFVQSESPKVQQFIQSYKSNFQRDPDLMAAAGYDAITILGKTLSDKNIDTRRELRDALKSIRLYPGVTGLTSLDGEKKLYILTIKNGQIVSAD